MEKTVCEHSCERRDLRRWRKGIADGEEGIKQAGPWGRAMGQGQGLGQGLGPGQRAGSAL